MLTFDDRIFINVAIRFILLSVSERNVTTSHSNPMTDAYDESSSLMRSQRSIRDNIFSAELFSSSSTARHGPHTQEDFFIQRGLCAKSNQECDAAQCSIIRWQVFLVATGPNDRRSSFALAIFVAMVLLIDLLSAIVLLVTSTELAALILATGKCLDGLSRRLKLVRKSFRMTLIVRPTACGQWMLVNAFRCP